MIPDPRLRMVFMGTADLAAVVLDRLAAAGLGELTAVVSQPDRPRGRDLKVHPTPVRAVADRLGIPVWQPDRARDPAFIARLAEARPDLIVVAAYGQILPPALLAIPRLGCLNVHTSLLPRHRGAAPIQWAIAEGDAETGVCLMRMDAGLDTGPVIASRRTPIRPADTGSTLHDRLAVLGAELLVDSLPAYAAGRLAAVPQPAEGATYARKITREDGRIDWAQPAEVIERRIRAFTPWPGSFTRITDGSRPGLLKVHRVRLAPVDGSPGGVLDGPPDALRVACGSGALDLLEVQPESGRRMSAADYLAGHRVARLD